MRAILESIGGVRRLAIAGVGLGVAALILIGSRLATAPTWVPAVTNVPLENASELTDRLDKAGIKYQLDRGGAEILVAQTDLARARVTLAKDGLPGAGRPGLELFDRPSWGWNDFTQHVNYRRALEGELERTIGRMRGIDRAEVHIAISEQTGFRRSDSRPVTASVLLAIAQGSAPAPEIVKGIAHLVSSSVDGLASENVSIHDETGRQWSDPNDDATPSGLSSRQLRVQQDVEKSLEKKTEDLLNWMVGPNNARVRVSAAINFDRIERTTQSIDPERQALASEQKSEIVPGTDGGAGSSNTTSNYENTKSTEVFQGATGNIRRLTVAVLVNDVRIPPAGPADTVPRFQPRSPAEMASIETLVRSAVGVDSTRGDIVSVISQSFDQPVKVTATPEPAPGLATRAQEYARPAITVVGIIFAFALALMAMRTLKGGAGAPRELQPQLAAGSGAGPAGPMLQIPSQSAAAKYVFRQADTDLRDRVVATVDQNPDAAARLVKAWVKEG